MKGKKGRVMEKWGGEVVYNTVELPTCIRKMAPRYQEKQKKLFS